MEKPFSGRRGRGKPIKGGEIFPRLREALSSDAGKEITGAVVGAVTDVVREIAPAPRSTASAEPAEVTTATATKAEHEPVEVWRLIVENAPALIGAALDGEIMEAEAHTLIDRAASVAHDIVRDTYARRERK